MVVAGQDPDWPDKAMYAGITLTLAGALGVLFAALEAGGATLGGDPPALLADWPGWIMFPSSLLALAGGVFGTRYQSALFVYLGAAFGLVSLSFLGLVPLLSLVAVGFMVKAHLEGEDTRLATPVPDARTWPDKALGAGLALNLAGVVTLFHGVLTLADQMDAVLFSRVVWGVWSLVAAAVLFIGAWEVGHLRRAWMGTLAGLVGLAGLGMYLLGPALALVALVLLGRAGREQEFTEASAT